MIDEMVRAAVAANPDGAALVRGERRISYRELAAGIGAAAAELRARGVRAGDLVLLAVPNSPEFAFGYFATARVGAAVQAADPDTTDAELQRQLGGRAPALVLTTPRHAERFSSLWRGVPVCSEIAASGGPGRAEEVGEPADAERTWVFAASSGTTGEPTRIARTAANQAAEAANVVGTAGISASDVLLCPVPLFHALGQFCCLLAGVRAAATLVLLDDSADGTSADGSGADRTRADSTGSGGTGAGAPGPGGTPAERIATAVQRHRPTIVFGVPRLFEGLLELPPERAPDLSEVRLCLSGSTFLPAELVERFRARFGVTPRQTYGSTETGSVAWDLAPRPEPGSVGTPLRGVEVRVLDADGAEVPTGAVGEIAVGGAAVSGVGAGASADGGSAGLHRTGDLGRFDAAGRLFVLGRTRVLVDTGGQKVNPVEVEDALTAHPAVREAAAVGIPLPGGGEALVAAVVAEAFPGEQALREHCRARLAEHKLPHRIHHLDHLPRTALGKVRRARLAAVLAAADDGESPLRERVQRLAPADRTTALAEHLRDRIAEVVHRRPADLDPDAPLHTTGLDSLTALRLRMAVQRDLRIAPPMSDLLGGAGISEVAERLAAQLDDEQVPEPPARTAESGEFPLSAPQLALWHAEQIDPAGAAHVLVFAARITSPCDPELLRRAFQFLVDRHPVLRTTFHERAGEPVQRVAEHAEVDFAVVDTDPAATARVPFDLAAAPALRVRLHTGGPRGPVLVIGQHHLITDYWSLLVLLRELAAACTAEAAGTEPHLPPPARTYADYARWLDRALASPAGHADLVHWLRRLRSAPPAAGLPTDRPRPPARTHRGAAVRRQLPTEVVGQLRECARAQGTTLFAVLLAAFHVLLRALTGGANPVVAVSAANRPGPEFADVLGYFTGALPNHVQIDPDEPFGRLAARVGRVLREDLDHPLVTVEQLAGELDLPRDRARTPLLEVGFGQNKPQDGALADLAELVSADAAGHRARLGPLALESVAVPDRGVAYELIGMVHDTGDAVSVVWEYNSDLFSRDTARRISERYARVLEAVTSPARPVREVAVEHRCTRDLLLAASRGPETEPPPVASTIVDRARSCPEAPAVREDERVLTRGALDDWSARIAAALPRSGRVVVWTPAGAELAAAGLGVLRAGALCDAVDGGADRAREAADQADVLVTTQERRALLGDPGAPVVCVDGELPAPAADSAPAPDSAALVVRTSGVREAPRAHLLDHRTLSTAAHRLPGGGEVLLSGDRSADRRLLDLLTALVAGEVAVPAAPGRFAGLLASGRVFGTAAATPAEVAEALAGGGVPRVGTLVVSGEVLPADLVRRWQRRTGGRVVHEYGGAGQGPVVSAQEVRPGDLEHDIVPVGAAAPGARRYVLDPDGELSPVGVPGEICVPPPPHHAPEPSAADPAEPGGRLMRTGDLGYYLPDGRLVVLGRRCLVERDRHYPAEPHRVEQVLRAHPSVTDAVALPGTAIVRGTATAAELRSVLRAELPAYAVPDDVVVVDRIPLSCNGKPRRIPPEDPAPDATDEPMTPLQAAFAEIWAEVLECGRVGLDDDFYALGGDSVLSLRVAAKAAERDIQVTRRHVFTHPTIRSLAAVARTGTRPVFGGFSDHRKIPLTPVQTWFFAQRFPDPHHWNQVLALRAAEPLDPGPLREALRAVAEHHSTLRLRYRRAGADGWSQVHDPTGEPIAIAERARGAAEAVREAHAAVDISAGPLLHAALLGTDRVDRVALVAHHLVVDFVSWSVLLDDLELAFRQLTSGEPVRLPPVPAPFEQWARRLARHADSPELRAELPFWLDQHDGASPAAPVAEQHSRTAHGSVPTGLLDAHRAPERVLVLAAVAHALAVETGQARVCLDVEGHGREEIAADLDPSRTIGWLTATHPLAVPAGEHPADTLAAARAALDRVPGGGLGHGLLRHSTSDAAVREQLAAAPAPQASVNHLGVLGGLLGGDRAGRLLQPIAAPDVPDRSPTAARPHRWEFSAFRTGDRLHVRLRHGGEPVRAARLVRATCAALRELTEHERGGSA